MQRDHSGLECGLSPQHQPPDELLAQRPLQPARVPGAAHLLHQHAPRTRRRYCEGLQRRQGLDGASLQQYLGLHQPTPGQGAPPLLGLLPARGCLAYVSCLGTLCVRPGRAVPTHHRLANHRRHRQLPHGLPVRTARRHALKHPQLVARTWSNIDRRHRRHCHGSRSPQGRRRSRSRAGGRCRGLGSRRAEARPLQDRSIRPAPGVVRGHRQPQGQAPPPQPPLRPAPRKPDQSGAHTKTGRGQPHHPHHARRRCNRLVYGLEDQLLGARTRWRPRLPTRPQPALQRHQPQPVRCSPALPD